MKCAICGQEASMLKSNSQGAYICDVCFSRPVASHRLYNEKSFLLPDSANSMASYHAKVEKDGTYKFSIHDCNSSIRLRGDLNTLDGINEAIAKINALESALRRFESHISTNYDTNDYRKF